MIRCAPKPGCKGWLTTDERGYTAIWCAAVLLDCSNPDHHTHGPVKREVSLDFHLLVAVEPENCALWASDDRQHTLINEVQTPYHPDNTNWRIA